MPGPGNLSPPVAELVAEVSARVASAATVQDIRAMADQAMAEPRPPLTMKQIGELFSVAMDRAQQVERLSERLAELLGDGSG